MGFTKVNQPKWMGTRPILCRMDGCSASFHTTSPSRKYCVECAKIPAWKRKKINDSADSVTILQPPLNEAKDIMLAVREAKDPACEEKGKWVRLITDNFAKGYDRDMLLLKELQKLKTEIKKLKI